MSGNGILNALNPLRMFFGQQRFTGAEFGRQSIAMTLAFVGFVALQIAAGAFNGEDQLVVPAVGTIDVDSNTALLASIAAGVAFLAAYLLGWNNIPDVPVPAPATPSTTTVATPAPETPSASVSVSTTTQTSASSGSGENGNA